MGATLIIWGSVVQQSYTPLRAVLHLLGTEVDLTLQGPLEPFTSVQMLKFCVLLAAAFSHRVAGEYTRAKELFALAKAPASQLDSLAKSNEHVSMIDHFMQGVDEQSKTKQASPTQKEQTTVTQA